MVGYDENYDQQMNLMIKVHVVLGELTVTVMVVVVVQVMTMAQCEEKEKEEMLLTSEKSTASVKVSASPQANDWVEQASELKKLSP